MIIANMENYLRNAAQSMINLCGENFIELWYNYNDARSAEADEDIPGFAELKALLSYCLNQVNGKTKYEKCTITAFMYALFYINDNFIWRYDRFRITSLNKVDELLQENFVRSGQHPSIVEVLTRFKNKYVLQR